MDIPDVSLSKKSTLIKAALGAVIQSDADFLRNLHTAGVDAVHTNLQVDLRRRESGGYLVAPKDPVSSMGTTFGFKYLKDLSFPASVLCYLAAQTMKALKGEPTHIVAAVGLIVGFWVVRMMIDLRSMYQKIYD